MSRAARDETTRSRFELRPVNDRGICSAIPGRNWRRSESARRLCSAPGAYAFKFNKEEREAPLLSVDGLIRPNQLLAIFPRRTPNPQIRRPQRRCCLQRSLYFLLYCMIRVFGHYKKSTASEVSKSRLSKPDRREIQRRSKFQSQKTNYKISQDSLKESDLECKQRKNSKCQV